MSCTVSWVPAISRDSFEKAYRDVRVVLGIPRVTDDKADVKHLVRTRLDNNILELGEMGKVEAKEVFAKRLIRRNQLDDRQRS